jgi:hypothetical protein
MPRTAPATKKQKKQSWLGKQLGDLKNVATGAPAALYETGKAIDQALPASHLGTEGLLFERKGKHLDPTALKAQGKAQLQGLRALGDPKAWKEDTALNLLTALGAAATVTGVGGVAGTAIRATARKTPKKPPSRVITAKPKDAKQAKKWAELRGLDPDKISPNATFKVEVPAAKPATTRVAQKGADKLRAKIPSAQRRKVSAHLKMEKDILNRLNEPTQGGIVQALKTLRKGDFSRDKNPRQLVREANAGLRGGVLYRPGYIGPNLLGANAANLIQMGADLPRQIVRGRRITKQLSPDARNRLRNMHGSGVSQAALDVGMEGRKAGDINPQGPVGTLMSGVGESLGKVTDRRARDRAFLKEAERQGYRDTPDIERLLDPAQVFDDPVLRRDLLQIVKRTEPAAIKFSRTTGGNKVDRILAENIFLYKWLTGSARYTGHVVGQHPTLTAALANLPEGEDITEALGVEVPEFMQSFIPYGDNKVINPQSLSLWETLPEFAETLEAANNQDVRQAIRTLAPVQRAGALAGTGYHTTSGKELSDYDFTEDTQRLSEGGGAPLSERLLWALNETASMSPYSKLSERYRSGLYPSTLNEELARVFTPLGGLFPRNVDPSVAAFIASAEAEEKKPKKKRGKKSRY